MSRKRHQTLETNIKSESRKPHMNKYFNFNNEEYVLPINEHEDGSVTFEVNGNEVQYASIQALAESYALARNVAADNLKNWVLVEDGAYYSFVLRAATAGADFFSIFNEFNEEEEVEDVEEELEDEEYDEEEEFTFDDLTREERLAFELMVGTDDEEVLRTVFLVEEDAYDDIVDTVRELKELGDGSFDFGYDVKRLIDELVDGNIPESAREEANRQLTMAAVAHRSEFQVYVLDLSEGTFACALRKVEQPFRPTELVVQLQNRFVVVEA